MILEADIAREYLDYFPEDGLFVWKKIPAKATRCKVGGEAGCLRPDGYVTIRVLGRDELAHRLAWKMVNGEIKSPHIDHINGCKTDNRISNLREATVSQNHQNKRKANSNSGLIGVSWCSREAKWRAYIKVDYKMKSLGYYHTPEEARAAYLQAKSRLHPFVSGQETGYVSS